MSSLLTAAFSISARISSEYSASASPFTNSMISSRSSSVTNAPWTRVGLRPMGAKSISPFPTRLSAPCWSRMMRLSRELATESAMRLGILAFMRPVMTSARGLWVATTRCMPAARPIWATRQMDSSTSFAAIIMRSASSSMKMTTWGRMGLSFWRRMAL